MEVLINLGVQELLPTPAITGRGGVDGQAVRVGEAAPDAMALNGTTPTRSHRVMVAPPCLLTLTPSTPKS